MNPKNAKLSCHTGALAGTEIKVTRDILIGGSLLVTWFYIRTRCLASMQGSISARTMGIIISKTLAAATGLGLTVRG